MKKLPKHIWLIGAVIIIILVLVVLLGWNGHKASTVTLNTSRTGENLLPAQPVLKTGPFVSLATTDIYAAGYAQVSTQDPVLVGQTATSSYTRYALPNRYFWVNGAPERSTLANLLMVAQYHVSPTDTVTLFNYGTARHPFSISGGTAQEGKLADGRIALNFLKGQYYVVIIGPIQQNIETLARIIAKKIS
jgi:hypothetical protein